jgi:hypothetical protein
MHTRIIKGIWSGDSGCVVLVLRELVEGVCELRSEPEKLFEALAGRVDELAGLGFVGLRLEDVRSAHLLVHGHKSLEGLGPEEFFAEPPESKDSVVVQADAFPCRYAIIFEMRSGPETLEAPLGSRSCPVIGSCCIMALRMKKLVSGWACGASAGRAWGMGTDAVCGAETGAGAGAGEGCGDGAAPGNIFVMSPEAHHGICGDAEGAAGAAGVGVS